jgi:ribosome maturation factor RimP
MFNNAMTSVETVKKIEALIQPVISSLGYTLWGCEVHLNSKHALLRVYIDRPEGVNLNDCAKISREISTILDVEDSIASAYTLEVSSPGINRQLYKAEQYRHFIGHQIKLKLIAPINNRRNFSGCIKSVSENIITLDIQNAEDLKIPIAHKYKKLRLRL